MLEFEKKMQAFSEQMSAYQNSFKELALTIATGIKKSPNSIKLLAENGWYVDMRFDITTVNRYANYITGGKPEKVDNIMIEWIDSEIDKIEATLLKIYPHRRAVISAGIKAHMHKEYYLSIPVFFSQAEGICREVTKFRFFKLKNGKPRTAKWKETYNTDSVTGILLEPLKTIGLARSDQNNNNPVGYNRHDVLHGDCFDYGEDKINSYKALSLLNYIGVTLDQLK